MYTVKTSMKTQKTKKRLSEMKPNTLYEMKIKNNGGGGRMKVAQR